MPTKTQLRTTLAAARKAAATASFYTEPRHAYGRTPVEAARLVALMAADAAYQAVEAQAIADALLEEAVAADRRRRAADRALEAL